MADFVTSHPRSRLSVLAKRSARVGVKESSTALYEDNTSLLEATGMMQWYYNIHLRCLLDDRPSQSSRMERAAVEPGGRHRVLILSGLQSSDMKFIPWYLLQAVKTWNLNLVKA